ncbi:chorismate synthase [Hippea alviniae]|uniref:chorismate synthase n=1 Tax=Hippea alviniae TaxID=1279027 RepID=UPI0003B52474|nr:chorismate synthase [Hippea alviniae]
MIRFLDAGESHGKALIAIIEGLPAGLKIDSDFINRQLLLRQSGYGRGGRQKIEKDRVEFLSGVRFGETIGSPIAILIKNRDFENWRDIMEPFAEKSRQRRVNRPRPGHADLTGYLKYDRDDIRDILERSSARETAIRVAVGSICELLLKELGVRIISFVRSIGKIKTEIKPEVNDEFERKIIDSLVFCPDKKVEDLMIAEIEEAKKEGDTLGGVVEVVASGVVAGVGSYVQWDRRLDARVSFSLMSIQAVKAVEIGDGFENAYKFGSQVHDEIVYDSGYKRVSNRAGGIEGGMSNGEDIVVRAYMKPIPTLRKGLKSVNIDTHEEDISAFERSDVTAVPSLSIVARSVVAFELANLYAEKFGGDTLKELKERVEAYKKYLSVK